jgi:hypothetical protein
MKSIMKMRPEFSVQNIVSMSVFAIGLYILFKMITSVQHNVNSLKVDIQQLKENRDLQQDNIIASLPVHMIPPQPEDNDDTYSINSIDINNMMKNLSGDNDESTQMIGESKENVLKTSEDELVKKSLSDLKLICKEMNIIVKGNKAEIIQKIRDTVTERFVEVASDTVVEDTVVEDNKVECRSDQVVFNEQ